MKLGPVTKLDNRNKKRHVDDVMSESCDVIIIFLFLANLEQSGGRIPDTESSKVMFSLIATSCLTKTENKTEKSLIQLSHYCFEERYFFGQKTLIFCKKKC